jgi:hypothetical protein
MTKERPSTYTAAPEPPTDPDLRKRYDQIMSVIAGTQTVAGAARELGMSRNHFQTLLHRGVAALMEAITPKPAGRPAKPEHEAALEEENEDLKAELQALKARAAMMDRLMTVVSDINSGREPLPKPRSRATKKKPEDPEPAPSSTEAKEMRDTKAPRALCAQLLGVSESTLGRRLRGGGRDRIARTPRSPAEHLRSAVCQIVRATHGLVGAASLGKRCGVSRRNAAAIKHAELVAMERERKARCAQVAIAAPGILRGFDAMHVPCLDGIGYWLIAGDAAVPYRTSITTVPAYDSEHVVAALIADFEHAGPPLVLRLDRIASQRTRDVVELLARYGVLGLHGPPRYPQYYGQLERQNRDHRAWLTGLDALTTQQLPAAATAMRTALNGLWARPTLGWCTAEQAWQQRPTVNVDRHELRRDVDRHAASLVSNGVEVLRARRIAIESALEERELLTINPGGSC